MNKKELKNLKNIKLTDLEKRELFERIKTRAGNPDLIYSKEIESPFFSYTYIISHRYAKIGVLAMLFISLSGASAYASLDTLPGDLLYGVKTNVVEKIPRVLYRTAEKRAEDDFSKIEKRIDEFEKLAEKGKLTRENTRRIEKNIEKNLGNFDEEIKEIERSSARKNENKRKELEEELAERLERRAQKIKEIRESEESEDKDALESVLRRTRGYRYED